MRRFILGLMLAMPVAAIAHTEGSVRGDGVFPMSADALETRFATVLGYWCRNESQARYGIDAATCLKAVEASVPRCRARTPFPYALQSWREFEVVARDFYRCAEPAPAARR